MVRYLLVVMEYLNVENWTRNGHFDSEVQLAVGFAVPVLMHR